MANKMKTAAPTQELEQVKTIIEIREETPESQESHSPLNPQAAVPHKISRKKKRMINYIRGAAGVRSKQTNPIFPPNSLSIVERYFHKMPSTSSQVVLTYGAKINLPPGSTYLSVGRVVDVAKITAAEIYRCCCSVDFQDHTLKLMAETADKLPLKYKFTEYVNEDTYLKIMKQEVNQRYDVESSNSLLWNIHVIGPKGMETGMSLDPSETQFIHVIWSFHHCICDGISGLAFIRVFMTKMVPEAFDIEMQDLSLVPVVTKPPPLLDNYIDPNLFQLIPAIIDFIGSAITKSSFKKYQMKRLILNNEDYPVVSPVIPEIRELTSPRSTSINFILLDQQFTDELREACRKNKTTIAAAVIVAALGAVRTVFAPRASRKGKPLPDYQSWVVTSSTRHLLPNSRLLEGSDKETDPSLMEFGGYGGSITNEKFRFRAKDDVWERTRSVKGHLTGSFVKSMRRMKLMNYIYRKPKLWSKLQKQINLEEMSKTYSVEVANIGAWSSPYAPLEVLRKDLATSDWFSGTLNNSFLGARALFTIALISINNIMSFSIAFDTQTVSEEEGKIFLHAIRHNFDQMRCAGEQKISVGTMNERFQQ